MLTRKNEDVAPLHHLQTPFDCVLPTKIGIWVSKVEMPTLKRHKSGICHGQNYVLNADREMQQLHSWSSEISPFHYGQFQNLRVSTSATLMGQIGRLLGRFWWGILYPFILFKLENSGSHQPNFGSPNHPFPPGKKPWQFSSIFDMLPLVTQGVLSWLERMGYCTRRIPSNPTQSAARHQMKVKPTDGLRHEDRHLNVPNDRKRPIEISRNVGKNAESMFGIDVWHLLYLWL